MLRLRDIQRRFDRAAPHFDGADFVHTVTRDGLVGRLEPLLLQPQTILDLGSATGATGRMLRRRFKRAHVVSLDLSRAMLGAARKSKRWFSRSTFVQADAGQLPFADESFTTGLLEYPQYTRPASVGSMKVPDVLLEGNHANIEAWRRIKRMQKTAVPGYMILSLIKKEDR